MSTSEESASRPGQAADSGWTGPALTPTEHRLFEVLSSQPGRVFTRPELVALVMPDAIVLERTVDVHVKALRRKLGPSGSRVETVRGRGYRYSVAP